MYMNILKKVLAFCLLGISLVLKTYAMDNDPTFTCEKLSLIFGQHPSVNLKVETMESFEAVGSPRSKCLFFQFKHPINSSNSPIQSFDLVLGDHYENDQIQFKLANVIKKLINHKTRLETEMLTKPTCPSDQLLIDCISSCLESTIQHEEVSNSIKTSILTATQLVAAK